MKAVLIRSYGGPDVLELADVPAPRAGAGEVVVKVAATSVNPVDWLVRDGGAKSFVKVTFPVILGCDLAGEIAEVGADVTRWKVGDPVFAMMPHDWGAHAERVAIAQDLVVARPPTLTAIEAAALPTVALTALGGLRTRGQIQSGEHVLINGASGGVGLAAVQIAKALGAVVTGVCGPDAVALVRRMGADHVIDYKQTDFTLQPERYDLIFDCVGNAAYRRCKRVLRGRRIHVTTVPGAGTFIRQLANPVFRTKVFGLLTRGSGADLAVVASLVARGELAPVIDKVFPIDQVKAALEYSKSGRAKGKIVLEL